MDEIKLYILYYIIYYIIYILLDRLKIKESLQNCMDPLATDTDLLNVVTGLHVTDTFNADESIKIEREHYGRI